MVARAKRNSAGSSHISMMLSFLFLYGMIDTVTSIPIFLGRGGVVTDSTIHDLQKTTALGNCFHELATETLWDTTMLQYDSFSPFGCDVFDHHLLPLATDFLWNPIMSHFHMAHGQTFYELAATPLWAITMLHYNSSTYELAAKPFWTFTMLQYNSSTSLSIFNFQWTAPLTHLIPIPPLADIMDQDEKEFQPEDFVSSWMAYEKQDTDSTRVIAMMELLRSLGVSSLADLEIVAPEFAGQIPLGTAPVLAYRMQQLFYAAHFLPGDDPMLSFGAFGALVRSHHPPPIAPIDCVQTPRKEGRSKIVHIFAPPVPFTRRPCHSDFSPPVIFTLLHPIFGIFGTFSHVRHRCMGPFTSITPTS